MKKKRKKKGKITKILEYSLAYLIILITQFVPLKVVKIISSLLGDLLYFLSKKRRNIAIENLRYAFKGEKNESDIKKIARQSCRSFFLTFLEIIKLRYLFTKPDALSRLRSTTEYLDKLFLKAKKLHDESDGCIFVTPHIGNWEILPQVCAAVGIPLVVVARPLENEYLQKLIFESRSQSGQIIIPKKNALFTLQKTLQQGKSIGLLPDQSTMKGILINFFGRKATTTPVPAILAVTYKRPIVVVACCRKSADYQYDGFVSDPIYPGEYSSEKDEIIRITEEMTRQMESIIRKYPEQYLWIHNRWKTYRGKKEFMSTH
ncbi:MAG: lysophospholipid acyltransferase family protein [Nitrospirae bacterium]|nr:lysophospholipid acyltransferase family protein [Nitrospirota bacterium]